MKPSLLLTLLLTTALHAESPVERPLPFPLPVQQLIDAHGKILFEDDFNREDPDDKEALGEHWVTNSESRAQGAKQNDLIDGTLEMTISEKADHAISTVHSTSEPYGDLVAYVRVKLSEGDSLKLAFNDKQYKEVWAGHINGATLTTKSLTLDDEKNGKFDLKVRELKLKDKKDPELKKILAATVKEFPIEVTTDEWHDFVTVHRGETLTAYLDGEEIGSFTSPGFAHETKRQFVFAVPKHAVVDHVTLWSLAPAGE